MFRINLDKKKNLQITVGVTVIAVVLVGVFIYIPLVNKYQKLTHEVGRIGKEIQVANNLIEKQNDVTKTWRLLNENQIVLAINEITHAGEIFHVDFISINPKKIKKLEGMPYNRLPIEISMVSEYKGLGLFLASLKKLDAGIITVESFHIQRDERILPSVKSTLVLEVYLNNG